MDELFHFYKGRVALHAILKAMDVGPGDEVIVPGFTCLGVPLPIMNLGAIPVYADITEEDFNIDLSKVPSLVTERTKAIVVQHTFGIPVDMDRVLKLAKEKNLYVIEDCCHTWESSFKGKPIGSFGHASFYSYEWGKPLVLGGGGSARVNEPKIREKVESIYERSKEPSNIDSILLWLQRKVHALILRPSLFWSLRKLFRFLSRFRFVVQTFTKEEVKGEMVHANQRMPSFLRAKLASKWKSLPGDVAFRRRIVQAYENGLKSLGLKTRNTSPDFNAVYLRYPLAVRDKTKVLEKARKRRIEVGDWFNSPVHPLGEAELQVMHYRNGSCPVAEKITKTLITLPIYNKVTPRQVRRTIDFLAELKHEDLI